MFIGTKADNSAISRHNAESPRDFVPDFDKDEVVSVTGNVVCPVKYQDNNGQWKFYGGDTNGVPNQLRDCLTTSKTIETSKDNVTTYSHIIMCTDLWKVFPIRVEDEKASMAKVKGFIENGVDSKAAISYKVYTSVTLKRNAYQEFFRAIWNDVNAELLTKVATKFSDVTAYPKGATYEARRNRIVTVIGSRKLTFKRDDNDGKRYTRIYQETVYQADRTYFELEGLTEDDIKSILG